MLDRVRKRPIVWINAPPGFGKTTLVASYLRARKVRPLWYQLDEGDSDLATFFHYLGLAVQKGAPRVKKPLAHLNPEYLKGLSTFTRRFFEELYRRLRSPAVLVFDNYHEVPFDAALTCSPLASRPRRRG
jgi:ATP/maltotriose-dependent transcriptional regulator MalT